MTLTEKDNGRTFDVSAESSLTVRLKENPTTGYRWAVDSSDGLDLAESQFQPGSVPGAGGTRILQFKIPSTGTHDLRLHHWREWEGDSSITDRFTAKVHVK
jgi:inhibitor of cysteine peptidase